MKILKRKYGEENFEICNWEEEKIMLTQKYGSLTAEQIEYNIKSPCAKKVGFMGDVYKIKR